MPASNLEMATALREFGERLKFSATTPNIHGYVAEPKQRIFHESQKRTRLYIGGNRSGKTVGGVVEDIWWATGRHPYQKTPDPFACGGIRGRVNCPDFNNGLEKTILPTFARWVPPSDLRGNAWSTAYDKSTRILNFSNGSFIEFMSYEQELDKFAGTSRHFIHYDEEPPKAIKSENDARLIDTGGSQWFTMTPVEGMTWVFDEVYEPGVLGSDLIDVIQVDMTENSHINPAEIQVFIDGLSEDEKESRVHGKFIQMGGLIYKMFDPVLGGKHVIKTPDNWENGYPPKDWVVVASLDHGLNNPTAWLWHAISPSYRVITFNEHYVTGQIVEWHATKVLEYNRRMERQPDYYVGDPSIRNKTPLDGTSVHDEYRKYGIPIILANNDVSDGINKVQRLMTPRADGKPLWSITDNCTETIKELARYRWRTYTSKKVQMEHNAMDEPNKKNDHSADSLRYMAMMQTELFAAVFQDMRAPGERPINEKQFQSSNAIDPSQDLLADPWDHKNSSSDEYAYGSQGWSIDTHMGGIF